VVPDSATSVVDRQLLLAALQRLSGRQRAVLVLRYFDDLSERETASALGCSPGAVKRHASRGLERLRELLGPEWDTIDLTPEHPQGAMRPATAYSCGQ
jgi:DNA-directed RNA polymerase specialized sigma24 family protein